MKKFALLLSALLLLSACGIQNTEDVSAAASSPESFGAEVSDNAEAAPPTAEPVAKEADPSAEISEPAGEPESPETEMPVDAEPETADEPAASAQSPVLVVYFSRMGNTDFPADVDAVSSASLVLDDGITKGNAQLLAEWMAQEAGCNTWEITTAEKYPTDYDETTDVAKSEQNDNIRPELVSHIDGFDGIKTIYLVYPN